MKTKLSVISLLACLFSFAAPANATENSTGELRLESTKILTVTAPAAPAVITLPKCPNLIAMFTPASFECPSTASICTLEATVTSEISDVTAGNDVIRFQASVDGAANGVLPAAGFEVNSTAKAGQIESATATWMHQAVQPGNHTLSVEACVVDKTGIGASAFAGDRILTLKVYSGN